MKLNIRMESSNEYILKKSSFSKLAKIQRQLSLAIKNKNDETLPVLNNLYINNHLITVEFFEDLSIEQVITEISKLSCPQIIVWYIGCYGLRDSSVQFYKNNLIMPICSQNAKAIFWLVDLTAWKAFKDSRSSIDKSNFYCDVIETFTGKQVKCIRSSKIFKKMQEISSKELINYFRKALCRDFIREVSQAYPDRNIQVREIFSNNCPIMADWYDHDVGKSYSIFQYLEGCLLVDEIFMHHVSSGTAENFQIVFALPNDELKYYRDSNESFRKDIQFLISKRCEILNIKNINLQIRFLSFNYGSQLEHRPYNAPGKVLKNEKLLYEDVVGLIQ